MMFPQAKEIQKLLLEYSQDEEICGVVIGDRIIQAENIADDPANHFELDHNTQSAVIRAVKAGDKVIVWHSHTATGVDSLSNQDVISARTWNLPYYMFQPSTGAEDYYDPKDVRPLEGRHWVYSHNNCYTLVKDYLEREFDIHLKDFWLPSPQYYDSYDFNSFLENIESQGFVRLDRSQPLQRGDIILLYMSDVNPHPCHVAAYDNGRILHHLTGHLSHWALYGSRYVKATHSCWRHQKLLQKYETEIS